MSAPASEARTVPPADLERVYLVGAAKVARFHELVDQARTAAIEVPELELLTLWQAVNHAVEAVEGSTIVKIKTRKS